MKCPFCHKDDDRVVDSRSKDGGGTIRRRRECTACSRRYTTYERVEEMPLRVVKKDGNRRPFDRQRILNGMLRACEKRPISMEKLEQTLADIEMQVTQDFDREVPSEKIGQLVMESLRKLDQVAYVRFASVYRDFKDVSEFMREVRAIGGGPGRGKTGRPKKGGAGRKVKGVR